MFRLIGFGKGAAHDTTQPPSAPTDPFSNFGDRLAKAVLREVEPKPAPPVAENRVFSKARSFLATDCYVAAASIGALIPRLILGQAHEGSLAHMVMTAGVVKNCLLNIFANKADEKILRQWEMLPVDDEFNLYMYQTVVVLVANGIAACLDEQHRSFVKVAAVFIAHFPPLQKRVMETEQFKLLTKHVSELLEGAKAEAVLLVRQTIKNLLSKPLSFYKLPTFTGERASEVGQGQEAARLKKLQLRSLIRERAVEQLPPGLQPAGGEMVDYHLRELEKIASRVVVEGGAFLTTTFTKMYFLNRTALVLLASYPAFGALALLFGGGNKQSLEEIGLRVASAATLVWTRSPLAATLVLYSKRLVDYASEINRRRKALEAGIEPTDSDSGVNPPATPQRPQNASSVDSPYSPVTPPQQSPPRTDALVVANPQQRDPVRVSTQVAWIAAVMIGPVIKSAIEGELEGSLLRAAVLPQNNIKDLGVFTNPSDGGVVQLRKVPDADFTAQVVYRTGVLFAGYQIVSAVPNREVRKWLHITTFFVSQMPSIGEAALKVEFVRAAVHALSRPIELARESVVSVLHPRVMRAVVANRAQFFKLLEQSGALRDFSTLLPKMRIAVSELGITAIDHCPSALLPASQALVEYHMERLVEGGAQLIVRANRNLVGAVVDATAVGVVRTTEYYLFYSILLKVFEKNPLVGTAGFVLAGGSDQSTRDVAVRLFGAGVLFSTKSPAASALIVRVGLTVNYFLKIHAWHLKKRAASEKRRLAISN